MIYKNLDNVLSFCHLRFYSFYTCLLYCLNVPYYTLSITLQDCLMTCSKCNVPLVKALQRNWLHLTLIREKKNLRLLQAKNIRILLNKWPDYFESIYNAFGLVKPGIYIPSVSLLAWSSQRWPCVLRRAALDKKSRRTGDRSPPPHLLTNVLGVSECCSGHFNVFR